jgi:ATP-binding cassette subfamily F protein uup
VVEDFPGNYSDFRAYEDSTEVAQRRKQSRKERLETKQPDWKFDFQRARISKNRKEIKFRSSKLHSSNCSRTKKYRIMTFQKTKELENINNKIEDREERWFELSAKIEG